MMFQLMANAGAILAAAGLGTGSGRPPAWSIFKIMILAGTVFVVPLFRYYGRTASPGAGDNLASSLMLVKLAEVFKSGDPRISLKHTRLIFLSFDGEENGQRGSLHYAEAHRAELLETKTFVFNIDTLNRLRNLVFLRTDTNGFVRLSKPLTDECLRIAAELGYPLQSIRFPFGGGGTDAGRFARIGVEAVSLIGISTRFIRKDVVYHTSRDTVENMEPEALEAGLNLAANYILEKDKTS